MSSNIATNGQRRPAPFLYYFIATYFVINALPFPLNYLPFINFFSKWYHIVYDTLLSWTGKFIFQIPFPLVSTLNGSGDTTYNYVQLFLNLLLAFFFTGIFFLKDKKQDSRFDLFYWINIYLRYWFALTMIKYGIDKVIKSQFPFPYSTLNKTYGDSSPMRLFWNFMGYSTAYNIFIGMIEIIAGTLVLFKRWALPGLMLSIAIMTNIVVLNFCYDVPVKLFSFNLLLTAFFLIAPQVKRLTDFFFRNKAVPAVEQKPLYPANRSQQLLLIAKTAVLVCILYSFISHSRLRYAVTGDGSFKRTPLFGIYNVKSYESGSNPALQTVKNQQWKTLSILSPKQATIEMEDGSVKKYGFITDTVHKVIKVQNESGSERLSQLFYTQLAQDDILLSGKVDKDSISVLLQKQDFNRYELINRSFHWINEMPYK